MEKHFNINVVEIENEIRSYIKKQGEAYDAMVENSVTSKAYQEAKNKYAMYSDKIAMFEEFLKLAGLYWTGFVVKSY